MTDSLTRRFLRAAKVARTRRQTRKVRRLLNQGANVNSQNAYGITALMYACVQSNFRLIKHLIEYGARINTKDSYGNSALMLAAMNGHQPIVGYLIRRGARIHARDDNGNTPLIIASMYGDLNTVRYLIKQGSHLHSTNNNGDTALTATIDEDIAEYLATVIVQRKRKSLNARRITRRKTSRIRSLFRLHESNNPSLPSDTIRYILSYV